MQTDARPLLAYPALSSRGAGSASPAKGCHRTVCQARCAALGAAYWWPEELLKKMKTGVLSRPLHYLKRGHRKKTGASCGARDDIAAVNRITALTSTCSAYPWHVRFGCRCRHE